LDPLAHLLCQVKTTALPRLEPEHHCTDLLADVDDHCRRYDSGEQIHVPTLPSFPRRVYWFLPDVAVKLALIKSPIADSFAPEPFKRIFSKAVMYGNDLTASSVIWYQWSGALDAPTDH
jgi:hypothetical protein